MKGFTSIDKLHMPKYHGNNMELKKHMEKMEQQQLDLINHQKEKPNIMARSFQPSNHHDTL